MADLGRTVHVDGAHAEGSQQSVDGPIAVRDQHGPMSGCHPRKPARMPGFRATQSSCSSKRPRRRHRSGSTLRSWGPPRGSSLIGLGRGGHRAASLSRHPAGSGPIAQGTGGRREEYSPDGPLLVEAQEHLAHVVRGGLVATMFAVGNIVFGHFEEGTPKAADRQAGASFTALGAVSARFGRFWFWAMWVALALPVVAIHVWWLPRKGINGGPGSRRKSTTRFAGASFRPANDGAAEGERRAAAWVPTVSLASLATQRRARRAPRSRGSGPPQRRAVPLLRWPTGCVSRSMAAWLPVLLLSVPPPARPPRASAVGTRASWAASTW